MKTGIFKLTEKDRQAFTEHLLRLSPEDRRMRFFFVASDHFIERMASGQAMHTLHGYFDQGRLVATSQFVPAGERCVEFAVTVDIERRGRGLAKTLLDFELETPQGESARELLIRYLGENRAMAAVHRGMPSTREATAGEIDVTVDLKRLRSERRRALTAVCGAEL